MALFGNANSNTNSNSALATGEPGHMGGNSTVDRNWEFKIKKKMKTEKNHFEDCNILTHAFLKIKCAYEKD